MDQDRQAVEIESVSSCSSEIKNEADVQFLESLDFKSLYLRTHAGLCLQTVLQEFVDSHQINVVQKADLEKEFNRLYYEAFSQCSNKMHVDIKAQLSEFSTVEDVSHLNVKDCSVTAPNLLVRVPQGAANIFHTNVDYLADFACIQ